MGRIRTKWTKTLASRLLEASPEKFSADFNKNKEEIRSLNVLDSKSTRNKIAGYVVTLVKKRPF